MNNNIPLSDDIIDTSYAKNIPSNPIKYFWILSFIAFIIKDFITALPSSVYVWVKTFSSYFFDINLDLSSQFPVWNILDCVCGSLITILFGVIFAKLVTRKISFEGNINKYKFFYYSWTFTACGFITDILGLISTIILTNTGNNQATIEGAGVTIVLSWVVSVFSFAITALAAYFCARLLNVTAFGDENKQTKELKLLASCVTISSILSLIIYFIRINLLNEIFSFSIIVTILSKVISVAVIWIAVIVKAKDLKTEKLIFTILPIIAICDSIIYSVLELFF